MDSFLQRVPEPVAIFGITSVVFIVCMLFACAITVLALGPRVLHEQRARKARAQKRWSHPI